MALNHLFTKYILLIIISLIITPKIIACGYAVQPNETKVPIYYTYESQNSKWSLEKRDYENNEKDYFIFKEEIECSPEALFSYYNNLEWKDYFLKVHEENISLNFIKGMLYNRRNYDLSTKYPLVNNYLNYISKVNSILTEYNFSEKFKIAKTEKDSLKTLYKKAYQMANSETLDKYLKERYLYFAYRIHFYLKDDTKEDELYEEVIKKMNSESILFYKIKGYKAYELFKNNKIKDALYVYSNLFSQFNQFKNEVMLSIKWMDIDQGKWDLIIKSENNKNKQVLLYMLRSLALKRDYSADFLDKMLILQPNSIFNEIVLQKIVLTIEDNNFFYSDYYNIFFPERKKKLYERLINVCLNAENYEIRTPMLWSTTAAYLSLLDNDANSAKRIISEIKNKIIETKNIKLLEQFHIVSILVDISLSKKQLSNEAQSNIVENISTLSKNNQKKIWYFLGQKFIEFEDNISVAMCYSKADDNSDKILFNNLTLKNKTNKNKQSFIPKFEKLFIPAHPRFSIENLYYIKGLISLRNNQLFEAKKYFELCSINYLDSFKVKYSKESFELDSNALVIESNILKFTNTILNLNKHDENVDSLFSLGNIYNYLLANDITNSFMSFSRNPRDRASKMKKFYKDKFYFTSSFQRGFKWNIYYPESEEVTYRKNLDVATAYYEKCFKLTTNRELKAKCLVLMNILKNGYIHKTLNKSKKEKMTFLYELNKEYNDTEFLNEFKKRCPLIEKFR